LRLDTYNPAFARGRPFLVEVLWNLLQLVFVRSALPGSWLRVQLLRLFGATIGMHVVIKPGLRVKFPWRLRVADWVWLGEDVWIDNLATVSIGSHAVISQGAYLCTGSHDWRRASFDLITASITVGPQAWVCAAAVLAPGTQVGRGAVVGLGAVASGTLEEWSIYKGNPAAISGRRPQAGP
jgi:putative colanic acid biosynthesis acetyltransferase WcaF